MSMTVLSVIEDAALMLGDVLQERISPVQWRTVLNRVQRKMATRIDLLVCEALFDIQTLDRYAWPEDCMRVRSLRFSPTPEDPDTYRFLDEINEPTWRARVNGRGQTGEPRAYFSMPGWYHLVPKPEVEVEDGGLITYVYAPLDITDIDTETVTFPWIARDHLVDGMVVMGHQMLKQHEEAARLYQEWIAGEADVKEAIEDRSQDLLPRIRPSSYGSSGEQW